MFRAMETNGGVRRLNLNLGDILHIAQIVALVVTICAAYYKLDENAALTTAKFDENAKVTAAHTQQLNRIEHYLSSKDSEYWNRSRRDE